MAKTTKKNRYKRVPHRDDRPTKKGSCKKEDNSEEDDEDKYSKKGSYNNKDYTDDSNLNDGLKHKKSKGEYEHNNGDKDDSINVHQEKILGWTIWQTCVKNTRGITLR
jgi:hypothetical protein